MSEVWGERIHARRVPCAGGIVFDAQRRLLVVQRGREPSAGCWSVPGGRCLDGESAADACVREVAEETGLTVRVVRLAGRVARAAPAATVYDIDDFVCVWDDPGNRVRASDGDLARASEGTGDLACAPDDTGDTHPGRSLGLRAADDAMDARWVSLAELDLLPLVPRLRETLEGWGCLPA